jgi:universal stress protein A
MLPVHTILFPTDFSGCSAVAYPLARALAADHGSWIVVLHVLTPSPVLPHQALILLPPTTDYQDELRDELARQYPRDGQVHIEHRLVGGDPAEVILAIAHEIGADLIIMGTHGRTGVDRLLMGSVAEQVVRKSPCPVLTVRAAPEVRALAKSPVAVGDTAGTRFPTGDMDPEC